MNTKIVVATHKEYNILKDEIYLPVFVGSSYIKEYNYPYQRDDEGENISQKNPYYSELTGLYWAFKNLQADYIGLCHYHRYINLKNLKIEDHEIILPKKRHYYIETIYDQFKHAHGSAGLDTAREVIKADYPEYLSAFDNHMSDRSGHNCNLFIMRYDIFVRYCDFLFEILYKAEDKLGEVDRLYGYIAERILDVFISKNQYEYIESRIIETEPVDWPKKIVGFLARKLYNKK